MQAIINNILDRFVDDLDSNCFIDAYAIKRARTIFDGIKNSSNEENISISNVKEWGTAFESYILACPFCNKQIDRFSKNIHFKTCGKKELNPPRYTRTKESWKCIYKEYLGKELKVIFSQEDSDDQLVRIFDLNF